MKPTINQSNNPCSYEPGRDCSNEQAEEFVLRVAAKVTGTAHDIRLVLLYGSGYPLTANLERSQDERKKHNLYWEVLVSLDDWRQVFLQPALLLAFIALDEITYSSHEFPFISLWNP